MYRCFLIFNVELLEQFENLMTFFFDFPVSCSFSIPFVFSVEASRQRIPIMNINIYFNFLSSFLFDMTFSNSCRTHLAVFVIFVT